MIGNRKSKTLDMVKRLQVLFLFNRNYLSITMGYKVNACVVLFTMNWGIIFGLNTSML